MAELVERPGHLPLGGAVENSKYWSAASIRATVSSWANFRTWTPIQKFIVVLGLLFFVKQIIFVLAFPAFSGHDEVAHYAYLRTLASEGRIPQIPELDEWQERYAAGADTGEDRIPGELYRYCRYFTQDWYCDPTDARFAQSGPTAVTFSGEFYPSGWIYTANHPPLYYVLMTPVYWLTDNASPATQLYVLRLAAVPFGLLTVLLAFLTVRVIFPTDRFLMVVVPTFVAFQTQISYEAAMLNNDVLGITTYSLVLYLIVRGIRDRFPKRLCIMLGLALGLAMLTKSTALTAVGISGLAILFRIGLKDLRGLLERAVLVGLPLAILVAPWYVFLYVTYGNFSALEQIRALQYWNDGGQSFFGMLADRDFAEMRFSETWGEFGWRRIPYDGTMMWIIGLPLLIAIVGLVLYAITVARGRAASVSDLVERPSQWQKLAIMMMFVTCVVAYLAIIQFGTEFELTQARYYFPVVNAVAILLALGLRTLIPIRYHPYGQGAVLAAMILLNTMVFTQYVIPYWQFNP
jgi:4-amino-4-deoxy-L-arabinose transferase-like glycosyltransferase